MMRSHNSDTFRVLPAPNNSRTQQLRNIGKDTLGAGNFRQQVKLPDGADKYDWIALNTVEFYNQCVLLYTPISKYCTDHRCPEMTAGPQYQYFWQEDRRYKPITLPAHTYIEKVFEWAGRYISNSHYFPEDEKSTYANDFEIVIRNIFKKLLRVYAHIYYHHSDDMRQDDLLASLNTSFRHFWTFSDEFKLIPDDQLAPLQTIIKSFEIKS
ncbi:Maintenance of ploidy protein mob1 [Tritrichomonas foetus]|uniref:Maintenance of ploidy protein mob1 n=1 Tax=Tritrichomonas foetus TaxID=1144522 RepID=A0A1J4J7F7_9EUKA|nr:Maintenance of ploidy protein mob1 [Tritrichomonas foetus]|eukprot:OHS93373.1 Maintenance of ploidy protein mob1 [Tritrichomonas foetus]